MWYIYTLLLFNFRYFFFHTLLPPFNMNRMKNFKLVYKKICEKRCGALSLNGIYFNKIKFFKLLLSCKSVNPSQCYNLNVCKIWCTDNSMNRGLLCQHGLHPTAWWTKAVVETCFLAGFYVNLLFTYNIVIRVIIDNGIMIVITLS